MLNQNISTGTALPLRSGGLFFDLQHSKIIHDRTIVRRTVSGPQQICSKIGCFAGLPLAGTDKKKRSVRMKEVREQIRPAVDLLDYKIRGGELSNGGGHKILAALIENPDRVNAVMNILDLELSEEETLAQVARLK